MSPVCLPVCRNIKADKALIKLGFPNSFQGFGVNKHLKAHFV